MLSYYLVISAVSSILGKHSFWLFILLIFCFSSAVFLILKYVLIPVIIFVFCASTLIASIINVNACTSVLDKCVVVVPGAAVIDLHPTLCCLLVRYLIGNFSIILNFLLFRYFLCWLIMFFSVSYIFSYVFCFLFIVVSYNVFYI